MAERNLTQGSEAAAVVAVSAPMVIGILGVILVGVADAYFLGRVGQTELAAVGFIFPVTTAIKSLAIGLSAGANAALSQSIGRGDDPARTRRIGLHAAALGLAVGAVTGLALWPGAGPLFGLLGAGGAVQTEILGYMGWWALGFPFVCLFMLTGAMFRSRGDGMTAAIIMASQAVLNIAMDPVLIFGLGPIPAMGAAGAGLATAGSAVLAALAAMLWAARRGYVSTGGRPLHCLGDSLRKIGQVGLPAAFSNAINPAGMAAVTAAVATLGDAAVAGFGAATRVQTLALVPMLALSAGIGPVIGQNWGAERPDRARRAVRATFLICTGYGAAIGAALFAFAGPIAGLIAAGQEDAATCAQYLRIVGPTLMGYGILVTGNAAMNARDRAVWSMALSLGRIAAIYLPLAWLLVGSMGFSGVAGAAAAANLAAIAAMLVAVGRTGLSPFGTGRSRAAQLA